MKLMTDYIGEITYTEDEIVYFEEGLYGFSEMKKFLIVANPEEGLPFHWLQSVDDERLVFIITTPFIFVDQYEFDLSDAVIAQLDIQSPEGMDIYAITVIPDELKNTTINLKAPIVINRENRKGKQIILNEEYPYKYKIFAKGI